MKFFYSLIVYAFSIVITLSIITLFVSEQSNSEELKFYTYAEGKFLVDYPSNYIVESQGNISSNNITSATSKAL
jgi:uncharacterized alpha/beta hydrolase family protein